MAEGDSNKCTKDTVQVALRIRPLMEQEIKRGCVECVDVINGTSQVQVKDLAFTYNYVFPPHISQSEFYEKSVKGLIEKVFEGYNATILAYGQTGSGKTYTMGTNYSGSYGDSTELGVLPRSVADIFNFIENHEEQFFFKVSVSFIELYKEQCFDLLSGKKRAHSILEIREDANKAVILPGLTEVPVTSIDETMLALERGSSRRVTGSTAMNQASSRSHAFFTISILKQSRTDKNLATFSKFHLVDLAGSERIKKTQASGERLKEGVKINQGLLALGNVISALGDGTNRKFISYRDSKLTRIIQDCLGGNSLTLMVACVSPADYNLDETLSTLRYADRAKRIPNKPIINQDPKAAEIVRLNKLVNNLELKLQLAKEPRESEQNYSQLQEELEKERVRYQKLLKKHKQVTEHLGNILLEKTNLCEKVLLTEEMKDNIERKLNELTEQCNHSIENLTMVKDDDMQKTSVMDSLKEIKTQLEDMITLNKKTNDEMIDHEIKVSFIKDNGDDDGEVVIMSEDQVVMEEEKRAMGQVELNKELQELNREMTIKTSVVQAILQNNREMLSNPENIRENEEKIAQLEKEIEKLQYQLKNTKSKDPSRDKGCKQVTSLEAEISELKKKCQQQANITKMTQKNEDQIASLNAELQAMKATKVKIIRQMREEGEKFRKWKAESERAMLQLKTEDRKRATVMAKMSSLHAKQQTVLKRKIEKAVAVNKRLKEALDRQPKNTIKHNAKGNVKIGDVQKYIEQQLEMYLSIMEAEKSLEELMDYRAWITGQIEFIRNSPDSEANREKLEEHENDLALRKAQISDLQQEIITADQETKLKTQWEKIESLPEAKMFLKCLFELLIDTKRDMLNQSNKEYQAKYEEIKDCYDRLKVEYENIQEDFDRQLAAIKAQNDEKIYTLLDLQRSVVNNDERDEACQNLLTKLQQDKLDQLEQENKKLSDELNQLRAARPKAKKSNKALEAVKKVEYIEPTDEEDEGEDLVNDPDWHDSPLDKRLKGELQTLKLPEKDVTSTRRSNSMSYCICRGHCINSLCVCVQQSRNCHPKCHCSQQMCKNRAHTPESAVTDNQPQQSQYLSPAFFDEREDRYDSDVRTPKHYFFSDSE